MVSNRSYPLNDSRSIQINQSGVPPEPSKYMRNHISTAKYSLFSFLPKFLFEQFRRYANIFFLMIGIMQQIPNVSPTGRYVTIVPLLIILTVTALKEILEDFKRHREDDKLNNSPISVLDFLRKEWYVKRWKDIVVGDVLLVEDNHFFPADLVLLSSSEPQGMCYIETSNLDGETNLKIRSPPIETADFNTRELLCNEFHGVIECEAPNRNLYDFKGNIKIRPSDPFAPISPSAILLRGTKLMNTPWIFGAAVYTGHESKLLKNSTTAPLKRSTVDRITNYQIIFLFLILVFIALFSSTASSFLTISGQALPYLGGSDEHNFFMNFMTFIILYNNLIPISLQVTLEMVRFIQAYFINWDREMFYEPSQTPAKARTSNLNEELGQIKYLFSDKTGTLTRNEMIFKRLTIGGKKYKTDESKESDIDSVLIHDLKNGAENAEYIRHCLILMAICHTVIPEMNDELGQMEYHASSPDEKALVSGAARFGFKFIARKPESVVIETAYGEIEEYKILNCIDFTSTRKRMTVIVESPDGSLTLYIKGADNVIIDRLGKDNASHKYLETTTSHLDVFAREGLRTLCIGMRKLDRNEYESWTDTWNEAATALEDREEKIDEAAAFVEKDLFLLGATAIEDKLQEGVPETIQMLLKANIKVWVLTGDKLETAINIGYSCKLLHHDMTLMVIETKTLDETRMDVTKFLADVRRSAVAGNTGRHALVVEGKSLGFTLEESVRGDFVELCCACRSVICCRISPIQKAEMVEMIRKHTKSICLAIGDGANDVAMIQKADVGVGISGNEGMQAANSSDFSIGQFKYLQRLLLVHGAWNYTRISKVILYSFYKNICLYIIELWFAIDSYWSGQVLFERWTIGLYNILFTSAPPIAMGLFDQYFSARTRLAHPELYIETQRSEFFNHVVFWKWIFNSIFHSIIIYWYPMKAYSLGTIWRNGRTGDYLSIGNMVYSFVVITVCLKAGLEMDSWNVFTHIAIWGSIVIWFTFLVLYSFVWPLGIPLAANMAGMIELIFTSRIFWLSLILVPSVAILLDFIIKVAQGTTGKLATRQTKLAKEDKERANESSSLLATLKIRDVKSTNPSEIEMTHGYAFSQEEDGDVSQSEIIRRYDTTQGNNQIPESTSHKILPGYINV
ncbi:phospholipid-transporting ATPase IB isoform X2 [Lepeophtheirus salmonis]|uniref:phospholipid-transporting ATPase IB isoform X2 n=1 Tax=Lepeophtheirus salmonis TaxID=72036 RepID=UPI001AE7230B|nr:phospholipid-transporting ATPase IB-like isoform X1 [Lepeophtheirus salmonis]